MRTDDILTLTQWLSPAFPVGAFAYSSGLESAIDDGLVSPDTLEDWLRDMMHHGPCRSDALAIRAGAAIGDPTIPDRIVRANCTTQERLRELEEQGEAFCKQLTANWGVDVDGLLLTTAIGHGCRMLALPADLAVTLYLQAWLGNQIACAQRLMALGQTEGQRILAALNVEAAKLSAATQGQGLDQMSNQCLVAEVAAMRHEIQSPRIFRT